MLEIVLATGNRHKVRELAGLLRVRGIRWRSLADYPSMRPARETGATFEANAIKKALAVARGTGRLALADDSGLEVEALGWGPGIRSARYAGRHKLLRALRGLPPARRRARYRCVLVLAAPGRVIAKARGDWTGRIAEIPKGSRGFGYDPLFVVPGSGKTVGQLSASVKRRLSHRAKAAAKLRLRLRRIARAARGAE
jgi:XTP/dITP diphosphohydrolase